MFLNKSMAALAATLGLAMDRAPVQLKGRELSADRALNGGMSQTIILNSHLIGPGKKRIENMHRDIAAKAHRPAFRHPIKKGRANAR